MLLDKLSLVYIRTSMDYLSGAEFALYLLQTHALMYVIINSNYETIYADVDM